MIGKIIKNISNVYTVLSEDEEFDCIPRGIFKKDKNTPLVGDLVLFDKENKVITKIMPRKNELSRPRIANIDYCIIVTSLKKPDLSLNLLDKQISYCLINNIKPLICFTKLDLIDEEAKNNLKNLRKYYDKMDILTFDNKHLDKLLSFLKDRVVVLTGQSGAGKSTLLNLIEPSLNLKTSEISLALNRGVHTTRHTEIYNLKNIWFGDTPGFSSLDLSNYTKEDIKNSFIEFLNYDCKFNDCLHDKENDCQVKKAVLDKEILLSRYNNYLSFLKEATK